MQAELVDPLCEVLRVMQKATRMTISSKMEQTGPGVQSLPYPCSPSMSLASVLSKTALVIYWQCCSHFPLSVLHLQSAQKFCGVWRNRSNQTTRVHYSFEGWRLLRICIYCFKDCSRMCRKSPGALPNSSSQLERMLFCKTCIGKCIIWLLSDGGNPS